MSRTPFQFVPGSVEEFFEVMHVVQDSSAFLEVGLAVEQVADGLDEGFGESFEQFARCWIHRTLLSMYRLGVERPCPGGVVSLGGRPSRSWKIALPDAPLFKLPHGENVVKKDVDIISIVVRLGNPGDRGGLEKVSHC